MTDSEPAFEAWVRASGPGLLRFGYLLARDGGRAEDLVQDTLVKVHRRIGTHGKPDNIEAFARRVLVNEFLSWWRRRSSAEQPVEATKLARSTDDVGSDISQDQAERDAMWRLLGQLPDRQRAVLVLRYYEGCSDREIGELLGCAEGTVRSLATRAFRRLRSELGSPDHPTRALSTVEDC